MDSIWTDTVKLPHFPKLEENVKTDVLVIGGGMAGILCAWYLQQAGMDYCLVEAETICGGVTKNTTAKITSQHGLIYQKLIREFDAEKALLYLRANELAIDQYRKICKNVSCNFEDKESYVYSLDNRSSLEKELEVLRRIGYPAKYVETPNLPIKTIGAVGFTKQAQFNPLKFVAAISKELRIFEHTKVTELAKQFAKTDFGNITADKIIVTTHFPLNNKHGMFFLKMFQHRSYVLALENVTLVDGMYVDGEKDGLSFRDYGDILLLGGGGHRTGKEGGGWKELREFTSKYYPNARIRYQFATQDCMTLDEVPYIGKYGRMAENLYVATGFNKWGMTTSMVAAMVLRDQILEQESPYSDLYNPQRTLMRKQLFVNGAESVCNLLTPSKPRCPHLGCTLKWNEQEKTWDCPCHGSRFEKTGELIDNPATDDLK